ncbi:MAG: protein kinase [Deltaproteobacteria bacterium]|nr:protein kinase [Deltaproteobacteria bacterium]
MVDPAQGGANRSASSEDEALAQRIGQVIRGKWRLDALLGVGGMASVYAASHRNGQRAAIKILHADFARDKNIYERFLREAYVSNQVNHPACVQVLDDDVTEDNEPFLVMQLLEGETLRDLWWRQGGRLPVPQALQIMERVLDCLASCHAIGVIHRDLKPANIFVTNAGETKVLDFGVAQMRSATAERTAMGTALGTPHYMSPEQAMGLVDQLDGRADIFSVGAMLHALVTGERINKGRTEGEALVMAATKPVPSVARIAPDLPIEVIALVDKALAWDKRNRYAGAREMQSAVLLALAKVAPELIHAMQAPAAPQQPTPAPAVPTAPIPEPAAEAVAEQPELEVAMEPEVAEDDPRVLELRELFVQVDRLLPSVRQFGWDHPATERTLRTAFERFVRALGQNPDAIEFEIHPYSFTMLGQTVWEPPAPSDAIPYNLFACGLRKMKLERGITMDELREWLSLLMLDPGRDLPPEDDIASTLWERTLPHVGFEVVDAFAEGDGAEREAFWGESDELEQMAASARMMSLEARAMAISTDGAALGAGPEASPMTLEHAVRAALASQLPLDRRRWSERYVDALVEGYVDTAASGDSSLVLDSLGRSTADLAVAGRLDVIVSLYGSIVERLHGRLEESDAAPFAMGLTNAMFRAETLALVLGRLAAAPDQAETFGPILAAVAPSELPTVLDAIRGAQPGPALDVFFAFVERFAAGHEDEIASAAVGLDPAVVSPILGILARTGTAAAKRALSSLAETDDVEVRIAVQLLTESREFVEAELIERLEDVSTRARMAALGAIVAHDFRGALPAIAKRLKRPDFFDLEGDECRGLLAAAIKLGPARGEPLVLELATAKGGLLASEKRDAVRIAAAEVLGALSASAAIATALRSASQSRWGASSDAREALGRAADEIEARAGAGAQSAAS